MLGITNVSSFRASVASMLIKMGFDIAVVYSKEENQYKINTRANKAICIKNGLNLGKIMEEISDHFNGSGGGHDGAAALNINIESDFTITEIIEAIKKYL